LNSFAILSTSTGDIYQVLSSKVFFQKFFTPPKHHHSNTSQPLGEQVLNMLLLYRWRGLISDGFFTNYNMGIGPNHVQFTKPMMVCNMI